MTDFGKYLTDYLNRYLTMECGCSYQTVKQYSVTFMLFIQYMYKIELIAPEKLCLKEFTKEFFNIVRLRVWLIGKLY